LGSAPGSDSPTAAAAPPSRYREEDVQTLMNLGASREMAVNALNATGGNVEYAAAMLF
jgi:DNA damage-inducible protein 1